MNVVGFGGGEMGAVNGIAAGRSIDDRASSRPEVWVGTTYALAAFMLGRGLDGRGVADGPRRLERDLEPRPLVPDARGVRRRRQLPGEPLPPAALDLGDRGSTDTAGRGSVTAAAAYD